MNEISNKEFYIKSSELRIEDFITNVKSEYSDNTIEAMFWDIYKEGNETKIADALRALEFDRKEVAIEVAAAILADQQKNENE